jgi:hypothetical protein
MLNTQNYITKTFCKFDRLNQACQTGGPLLSLKPSKGLNLTDFGIKRLLNRKKLMIFPNCGPLTVLQSFEKPFAEFYFLRHVNPVWGMGF